MLDMIDVTNAIEFVAADFPAATAEFENERTLGDEIASLWSANVSAKKAARATNSELRAIRARLGKQFHEMKQMLAKPGRGGQWSSFLKERQIPRATADRLAERHQRSLSPSLNCVTEEVSEPTDEDVQKLFNSLWPKLRRTLRSQQSVLLFVDLLTSHFKGGEPTAHELPAPAPATAAFDPPSPSGNSSVEPESYIAVPLETDQGVVSAP
jgi:hypothetical protein